MGVRSVHRGVRGSAALVTARVDHDAVPAERLEAGEMRRLPFGGELLGAVRVRAAYAPVPLEAFDRAAERVGAEAQAAYLQLLRLSYGEGRNFCRVAKRELEARLRLSERRLLRVLDELVAAGLARPLHRDNRGTLWRVLLPREADGGALGDDVLVGRASPAPVPSPPARHAARRPAASPGVPAAGGAGAALSRALAAARGREDTTGLAEAAAEIRELLAEGQTPARIAAAIEAIRRRQAREAGGTA